MLQQIDWPGIRALAVAIGVREAARRSAADLPEDEQNRFVERVMKRSQREGWIVRKIEAQATRVASPALPMSAPVRIAADSMAESLEDDSKATRIGLSQASRRAADHLRTQTGANVLKSAKSMKEIASVASIVHGWEAKKDQGVQINLNVAIGVIG